MPPRSARAAIAGLSMCAVACAGSSTAASSPGANASGNADALAGSSVTVLAAASLTEAFDDARPKLQSAHPGLELVLSFAGSQALVRQVENGAPADVIATADPATMQVLVGAGLVETPRTFAHNKLEIVVAPGNPRGVTGLHDLGRSDLKVVLDDASVPAGKYGRQALQAAGVAVHPVSEPLDVKSELLAVEQGNADAGIVYVTDVASAGAAVAGVEIPDSQNVLATYPIAVVRAARDAAAARAFVDDAVGGTVQQALRARGFLAP